MTLRTCETCKFAEKIIGDLSMDNGDLRHCRRYPPEVRLTPGGPVMMLPIVRAHDDYCGEHQLEVEL